MTATTKSVNYTPGPWIADLPVDKREWGWIRPADAKIMQGALKCPALARVYKSQCSLLEAEANARLIAAAPEMLNELEINLTVLRDVQKYLRNRPGNEPEQLCEMVGESIAHHEAAIRKAKGEL